MTATPRTMRRQLQRSIRRLLGAGRTPEPIELLWRAQRDALTQAALLVRVFYLCLFFIILQNYPNWPGWLATARLDLLWPVLWFRWSGNYVGVAIVIALSLATSLLAAAWPTVRWARIAAMIGILEFGAFFNSFGAVNHGWHVWIWAAAIFVLLPDGHIDWRTPSLVRRQRYLRVFWFALASPLLFYSLSGAIKIAATIVQWHHGQSSALSPDALARQIAYHLQEGTFINNSVLGATIVRHPMLGWPLYLLALYFETFSLLIAFRPATHRLWGMMLIAMHVGVYLMLAIMFSWQMLAVGLLLLCSPFAPPGMNLRHAIAQLPIIGDVRHLLCRRHTARITPLRKPLPPVQAT